MSAEVKARLDLDGNPFQQGLAKAQAQIGTFATGIKGVIAGAFTVGAITAGMKSAVDYGSKLNDTAERLGVNAGELEKLAYAAKQTGSGLETITAAWTKMAIAQQSGIRENGEARRAFEHLGISAKELEKLSLEELFRKVADGVKDAKDQGRLMADVQTVLGRSGGELIPMLRDGSDGLKEFADEAARFHLLMGDETIKKMDEIGDSVERFNTQIRTGSGTLAGWLAKAGEVWFKSGQLTMALYGRGSRGDFKGMWDEVKNFGQDYALSKPKLRKSRAPADEFEMSKTSDEERKADRIKALRDQIGQKIFEQGNAELSNEQKITALKERQAELMWEAGGTDDLEERLKFEKKYVDLETEILQVKKKQREESQREAEKRAEGMAGMMKQSFDIMEIQRGKGVSVSAPITDQLARIGGFVGGQADPGLRMAERQLKIEEEMRDYLRKIAENNAQEMVEGLTMAGIFSW